MRGVAELAELARDQVRDLLADVDRVVADSLDTARDDQHPQTVLTLLRRVAQRKESSVALRFARSISSSSSTRVCAISASREANESSATRIICSARWPMSSIERHDRRVGDVQVTHQLGQLRDRDAVVGHPLEVKVDAEDREHEPQVGCHRGLAGEQRLDALSISM